MLLSATHPQAEVNIKNTTTDEMMDISSDLGSIIYGAHNGEHRNK